MEEALVSAATGALGPVVGKLAVLAADEYHRLRKIRDEIGSLSAELKFMAAFLEEMSAAEEDPGAKDKLWTDEVRELSYDVEDSIDDFMARVDGARPDGFMDKIKGLVGRTKARHGIAGKIQELKKQILEVSQRNERYRLGKDPGAPSVVSTKVDLRALAIFEEASHLVGLDGPKEQVLQLLADDGGDSLEQAQPIKLVAIVGAGGMGKTTLANRVYQELKAGFDCHANLSVSRNPDLAKLMRNILSQFITSSEADDEEKKKYSASMDDELPQLITKIRDFLLHKNKRYFVVVDDIWNVETWNNAIKHAFPITSSGSKIITTTRINVVAKSCSSSFNGHVFNIRPLDMVYSRQLFYGRLFSSETKCPSHLEGIATQILERCAGLPLAIIAIAGLLADKASEKDQWEQVRNSIGRALRNSGDDAMVKIISLSYLDLPRELKTCLLYLSIFPEDHNIEKENLIRRWIGEGFIHKQGNSAFQELGEKYFNDLINRSLIQHGEIDGDGEVKSCRVHDTVLDFIVSKAVEENFVTIVGVPGVDPDRKKKVRRLSLQNDGEIPAGLVLSSARSLHVFGSNTKIPSLSEFRLLRVLDFEECSQLEDGHLAGLGSLVHLKYLRFKHAHSITKLPEEVARLQHLEIDIHGYMKIMEVPLSSSELQRLVRYTLVLDDYHAAPDHVVEMQGLRVLEDVSVYNQSMEFLEGLALLENLRKMSISFTNYYAGDDWEEKQAEMVSSIAELSKAGLESLHISINEAADEIFEEDWFPDDDIVPYGLREFVLEENSAPLSKVPTWMAFLVKLEKLCLPMDDITEEDMEILGGLPCLRHLCIQGVEHGDAEAAMRRVLAAHPNRPTLVWTNE